MKYMLILIGGEKGGTGKSCLTQNIAVLLQRTESSILIIDCDPQKTTSDWAQERCNNTKKPHIECIQMYGNILHNLESLKLKYKIILVDCGGQDWLCCMNRIFDISPPFPVIWAYATRIEIGLPISNILFKSWHLIVISFFMLSSSLDRNLLPKAFLNLKKVFSTNSLLPYLFLFLQA